MVLPDVRRRLRTALASLVNGQFTNDEFDEVYAKWQDSDDQAVAAIAEFGYGLYSSDLLLPYRLAGRYAVDPEILRIAERCLLFLQTDLEYAWPAAPNQNLQCAAGGFAISLGIPLGIALLV